MFFADLTRVSRLLLENWPILAPVALGFLAIYWLLPQARGSRPLWGALAGAAALVLGGWFLVHAQALWVETLLFYVFAGLAVVSGTLMITQQNPVHAALSFALVVLSTCGLFLLQAAPFLMAATIIIYAGAIVVTFLFVIMLAQQAGLSNADQRSREPFLGSLAGFVLLAAILCVLQRSYSTVALDAFLSKAEQASKAKSVQEIAAALGDADGFLDDFRRLIEGDRGLPVAAPSHYLGRDKVLLADALNDLQPLLRRTPLRVDVVAAKLAEIHDLGVRVRYYQGSLQPSAGLKVSKLGGTPPNADFPKGKVSHSLPAENVKALGRSLFTDHLLAVELAAVLLLVAPIGAIAIAVRRTERL